MTSHIFLAAMRAGATSPLAAPVADPPGGRHRHVERQRPGSPWPPRSHCVQVWEKP
jgi:hypothetical protein